MYSILVLTADAARREQVCGEISRGLHCEIYMASDAQAALALVRAEKPTLFLLTPDLGKIHDKPIAELVMELSPETVVAFLAPPPLSMTAAGN